MIDLKMIFHDWAAEAKRGDTMKCTDTAAIEAESGRKCMYENHHIKAYEFYYTDQNTNTATGIFVMDDGKKITAHCPTADHPLYK